MTTAMKVGAISLYATFGAHLISDHHPTIGGILLVIAILISGEGLR